MERLKAQIKSFIDEEEKLLKEEKELLHKIYSRFIEDHAYLWEEFEDLEKLRHILLVIIKLFYEEHRRAHDVTKVDYEEFKKDVRELVADQDALLQRARNKQIKEIEFLGLERWFEAFKKDIERINEVIEKNEGNPFLRNLLSYKNPNLPQYQKLIRQAEEDQRTSGWAQSSAFLTSYDGIWTTNIIFPDDHNKSSAEKVLQFLKSKLEGSILIDLAAGGNMIYLSERLQVKTYIEVNLYRNKFPNPYIDLSYQESVKKLRSHFSVKGVNVGADALDFASRIKSNSVNFIVNGFDSEIVTFNEYHEALANEMIRATVNGGLIFGLNSTSLVFVGQNPQIKVVVINNYRFYMKVK